MKTATQMVLFFVLLPQLANSQSVWGGAGFLFGGQSVWPGSASAMHQLNPAIRSAGNDGYPMVGAEAYIRVNRWLIGATASSLTNKPLSAAGAQPRLESSASNAHLWVGWVAWQSRRTKLYPSVGPGYNSLNVNAIQTDGTVETSVLDGFATDLGLTVDWHIVSTGNDPLLLAGPLLSLRVGYRLTTASATWHGDRPMSTTLVASRYSPHGFYITLGIGGGGFRRKP
ncbi:hypothetical protein J2I47_04570 [Fibrella sp. HMF5335]|uniref:Outer membrane protein beta-barrel domain-containing protein n=1 Tax=Fibrella rubiginis TaxID=2817060 RepID=A0A939K211_9BACT|nr:hypothetical protein [Fibrella rubiginis]MBO0935814.1 hypothetical protein [Fibrella rubiginis]